MKHYLNVRRVSFGTGVKLRPVFRDLLQKAMTQHDVDIALCALVEFVRLEMTDMGADSALRVLEAFLTRSKA